MGVDMTEDGKALAKMVRTRDVIVLGRRAIACAGWRPLEGMIDTNLNRIVSVEPGEVRTVDWGAEEVQEGAAFGVPDLTDPATLGCLLALVREAWGDPHAVVYRMETVDGLGWGLVLGNGNGVGPVATGEAEALVAAFEAAPRDPDRT